MGAWQGRTVRGLLALLLVGPAPLTSASPAAAQSAWQDWQVGPFDNVGVGLFLGYAFGDERGLEWGAETFGTVYFKDRPSCSTKPRSGLGPMLRLSILRGFSRAALTGALHVGGEVARPMVAFDAELGGTLAFQRGDVLGAFHTGQTFQTSYLHFYGHQEWFLPSYSLGGGVRAQPLFGFPASCEE